MPSISRKIPARFLFLVLPVLTASLICLPATGRADFITVKGSYLNVRSGPGTSYEILRTITEGESFPLAGIEGLWCRIVLEDGKEAWVYRSYVEVKRGDMPGLTPTAPVAEETPAPGSGSVWAQLVLAAVLLMIAAVAIWRRHELMRWLGRKMQAASGYRREDPFRYDARHPDRDEWKL